jgi:hypothetical protein
VQPKARQAKRRPAKPFVSAAFTLSLGGTFRTWGNRGTVFALTRLWNAVAALARRLEALASTVGAIDGALRQRIGQDGAVDGPVLDYTAPAHADGNGRRAKPARGRK